MLLVTRVGPASSATWTCVDPTLRVQLVNLRDKSMVSTKPIKGVDWTEHPGLSASSRDQVLAASEKLIARKELEESGVQSSTPKQAPQKAPNKSKARQGAFKPCLKL